MKYINRKFSRSNRGNISEFAPALFILIFMGLIPCLNLLWLACTYVIVALAANFYVSSAAVETSYERSLAAMYSAASQFNGSNWNLFGGLAPYAGYANSGSDLYVKATAIDGNSVESFGPNISAPPPIDSSSRVWEFECKVNYDVRPLLDMSAVPFISDIPGLGQQVRFYYSAHKIVEHPEGLAQLASNNVYSRQPNGSIMPSLPNGTGGGGVLPDGTSWFNPEIYELVAAAGQTIVQEDVLQVAATNSSWTSTGLTVGAGQQVWIDLRADGMWTIGGHGIPLNADGQANPDANLISRANELQDPNEDWGKLIGRIGGTTFGVGRFALNMAPPATGDFSLIINDSTLPGHYNDNTGLQTVRIIVTR